MDRILTPIAFIVLVCASGSSGAEPPSNTTLTGQVDLARLVDLCAERLDINIEYDAGALRGSVTLRLGAGVTDNELWLLTNRVLASRGFASVRMPGEEMFSIVKVSDAPGMARLERDIAVELPAGFVTNIVRLEHQSPTSIANSIKNVLSRTGGTATPIGETSLLLISDLKPRVEESLRLIGILDVPGVPPMVERIAVSHVSASQVAPLVTAAAASRDTMTNKPLKGKITPVPDGSAVVLVAPPDEVSTWRVLLERFDQREEVFTRSYSPRHFGVDQVAQLIEQIARASGPGGSGDQWNLVTDDLTGTIIVTGTPSEHAQVELLLTRLDAVPGEARRPVRAFAIRNRSVREVIDVVQALLGGGLDVAALTLDEAPEEASGVSHTASQAHGMRSGEERLVLTADEGTNTLIATGDHRALTELEKLVRRLDLRQPQVMVDVLVVNLTQSQTLDLGVELEKLEISGSTLISLSSLFGISGGTNLATLPSPGGGFTGVVLSPGDFSVVLRALQTVNRGRTLTMPKVLVNNNQTATLDSVLQQPFSTLVSVDQVTTTSLGGTLDAGTAVTITPQIAERDHLVLEYAISLSSFVGESPDPLLPPPRQQNKLQSIVTIPDGYTVVVGGLELNRESEGISQVPLLGGIPILGEAFKSRSNSSSRSRFYVFIRTNVLRNEVFEDLKYLSDRDAMESSAASVMQDFPSVQPRVIH